MRSSRDRVSAGLLPPAPEGAAAEAKPAGDSAADDKAGIMAHIAAYAAVSEVLGSALGLRHFQLLGHTRRIVEVGEDDALQLAAQLLLQPASGVVRPAPLALVQFGLELHCVLLIQPACRAAALGLAGQEPFDASLAKGFKPDPDAARADAHLLRDLRQGERLAQSQLYRLQPLALPAFKVLVFEPRPDGLGVRGGVEWFSWSAHRRNLYPLYSRLTM